LSYFEEINGIKACDNVAAIKQCVKCGPGEIDYIYQRFSNYSVHIKSTCKQCGAFLGWAKQVNDVNKEPEPGVQHFNGVDENTWMPVGK